MEVDLFGALLTFLVLIIVYLVYKYTYAPYQVFKCCGVKGPTPTPIFGNYFEVRKMGAIEFERTYFDKYGPVFGHYIGQIPCFNVIDPELLKQITVTEFGSFMNRLPVVPLMEDSLKTLTELMEENARIGKGFNIIKLYEPYVLEILMSTSFGRVIDVQRGQMDPLTEAVKNHIQNTGNVLIYNIVTSNFPWIDPLLGALRKPIKYNEVMMSIALSIIKARRAEGENKKKDLLQLMMDATIEEESEDNNSASACPMQNSSKKKQLVKLTDEQLTHLCAGFFLPGYGTTTKSLAATSYLLAMHPHIQEELQTEIDNYYKENPEATLYQAALDIKLLDMVVQESLRLYPTVPRTLRLCNKTTTIGGIVFPEGCKVYIPIYLLHYDPKSWQDPEKFDPMRFTPEEKAKRSPLSYMPFGYGQRNCIAMRFALLEIKLTLIALLQKFTFLKAPNTKDLKLDYDGVGLSFKQGIGLKIADRKK